MTTRTALVIEEEADLRQLYTDVLALEEIAVNGYASPEAYYLANGGCWCRHDPCPCHHFMLIDKQMPNMSGLDFLCRLEEKGCRLKPRRKAVISGDWPIEDLEAVRKRGYQVLEKPCHVNDLLNWIQEADSHPKTA